MLQSGRAASVYSAVEKGQLIERTVSIPSSVPREIILGPYDRNIKMIRECLGIHIAASNGSILLRGPDEAVARAGAVLDHLAGLAKLQTTIDRDVVLQALAAAPDVHLAQEPGVDGPTDGPMRWSGPLAVSASGRAVKARTPRQEHYLEAMRNYDLVFAVGPAGTGKTYLAVATAVHLLKAGLVRRLVLARPAVEAGERLGFLPGDLQQKVNPYLRPLFDALREMLDYPTLQRYLSTDIVEVVPLAFMRGRTLNDAFIILDEAQNTTIGQMMMFLTRMGRRSKCVVTGDTSQVDLPEGVASGLIDARQRLAGIDSIGFVRLEESDIVRHALVQQIVAAYGSPMKKAEDAAE